VAPLHVFANKVLLEQSHIHWWCLRWLSGYNGSILYRLGSIGKGDSNALQGNMQLGVVVKACNLSIWEAKAGEL
jgi:hypothetical protein